MIVPQDLFDQGCRAVANARPDDLRRRAVDKAALVEIRVFRGNNETMQRCLVPNFEIVRAGKA